jgi:UDP-glucose 4-epimerase
LVVSRLDEDPVQASANVTPSLGRVEAGEMLPAVATVGKDYDTSDVTCAVDQHILVMDLASAHVAAVKKLESDRVHFHVRTKS